MVTKRSRSVDPRLWWLAGLLGLVTLGVGCSPSSIAYLLMPFVDDKIQPRCKLARKGEEVTVVVFATFGARGEIPLDLEPAANELGDVLSAQLRKRFAANKEKVNVVPASKVRSFMNSRIGKGYTDQEIGEHFKADYVVGLEIQTLGLYQPGSSRTLFHGTTEIGVVVTDVKARDGEGRVLTDTYRNSYGPKDAGGISPTQFRTLFVNRISRDLSRWFAAYAKEERLDMD